jgi:CheY-like chemotaxis protein/DNA-directed RNA polymerase specialized sigma24 family protein
MVAERLGSVRKADGMQEFANAIRRELPYLRRYARALCGEQSTGDRAVRATLEHLLAQGAPANTADVRLTLFEALHLAGSTPDSAQVTSDLQTPVVSTRLVSLTPLKRQALLLTTLEGFSPSDAARILALSDEAELRALVQEAKLDLRRQDATRILIIEDEPVIALDIASTVEQSGHVVVGIAATRAEAVALAGTETPGLILADIQLADDSSGIDAAHQILAAHPVPVIFITAFPERLLTGERPEPAFLITKPFDAETLSVTISQALMTRQDNRKNAA